MKKKLFILISFTLLSLSLIACNESSDPLANAKVNNTNENPEYVMPEEME